MKLKFTHLEKMKDGGADLDMDTHCVFGAVTKIPFRLNQNHALLTFEDEEGKMCILIIKLKFYNYISPGSAVVFPQGYFEGNGENSYVNIL